MSVAPITQLLIPWASMAPKARYFVVALHDRITFCDYSVAELVDDRWQVTQHGRSAFGEAHRFVSMTMSA